METGSATPRGTYGRRGVRNRWGRRRAIRLARSRDWRPPDMDGRDGSRCTPGALRSGSCRYSRRPWFHRPIDRSGADDLEIDEDRSEREVVATLVLEGFRPPPAGE